MRIGPWPGGLSAALLQRHDARVLDPSAAATIPDSDPPRSTIYRARTLLVPVHLLDQSLTALNDVLVRVGMHLRRLADVGAPDEFDLPELAVLVPAEEDREKKERPALPVVVDAWVALQALRAAARPGGPLSRRSRRNHADIAGAHPDRRRPQRGPDHRWRWPHGRPDHRRRQHYRSRCRQLLRVRRR